MKYIFFCFIIINCILLVLLTNVFDTNYIFTILVMALLGQLLIICIGSLRLIKWYRHVDGANMIDNGANKLSFGDEVISALHHYYKNHCLNKPFLNFKIDALNIMRSKILKQNDAADDEKANNPYCEESLSSLPISPTLQENYGSDTLIKIGITDKPILSLPAYVKAIKSITLEFFNIILMIYKRSHSAIYRTEQIVNQVDDSFDILNNVNSISEETSLLALNVYFDSAKRGHTGVGDMSVAEEVKKLSEHSKHFADEIRKEVNVAKKTVNDVKALITQTADKELMLILAQKENIDEQLSKLLTLNQLFVHMGVSNDQEVYLTHMLSQSQNAIDAISESLHSLTDRINIVQSKKALTLNESEFLEPILAMSKELQTAHIVSEFESDT